METIIKVKLNATLKCGSEVWEAGVYDAPVPSDILAEESSGSRTREGARMVDVLERKKSKPTLIRTDGAPTSISSVTSSNVREGPLYEAEKKDKVPMDERKEPASEEKEKPKLVLRR